MAKNKEMGNVPNLRFPEFTHGWEVKKLGDLLEFKNGINASKEQYGSGVKFINVLDILNNDFITSENIVGRVNVEKDVVEKFSVKYGDILFQRSSETREEVGTANVYLDKESIATFGGFVIRGRKIGDYEPIFLNKLLQTSSAREDITSKSGGSTRYNVGQDILSSISLHFPNLIEQNKIASFFEKIDQRITTQSKIIDKLKTSIKILRKKVFNQDLRFKDDNGNSYPNWETKKLGHLGTFFSGGTPLTTKRHYFDGNIPFIRSGEINASSTEQYISKEGLKNSSAKMVEIGDLIYALYGATSGEVGISKIKGAINQAILCLRTDLNNVFLLNYLKFQKENILSTFLQGGQGNLSAEIIKSLKIPVPTIKEQAHIASVLSNMESKIELEINILNTYQKQKQYLLSRLFI